MKKTDTERTTETEPAAKEPRSKRYEEAFKKQAVEHWLQSGKPGTQIARELGVSYPTLKQWKRCYWGDAMPVRPDLERENHALRAELARVREQRDILKKTLGIFAVPSRSGMSASKP
jgi:transposase